MNVIGDWIIGRSGWTEQGLIFLANRVAHRSFRSRFRAGIGEALKIRKLSVEVGLLAWRLPNKIRRNRCPLVARKSSSASGILLAFGAAIALHNDLLTLSRWRRH